MPNIHWLPQEQDRWSENVGSEEVEIVMNLLPMLETGDYYTAQQLTQDDDVTPEHVVKGMFLRWNALYKQLLKEQGIEDKSLNVPCVCGNVPFHRICIKSSSSPTLFGMNADRHAGLFPHIIVSLPVSFECKETQTKPAELGTDKDIQTENPEWMELTRPVTDADLLETEIVSTPTLTAPPLIPESFDWATYNFALQNYWFYMQYPPSS